MATLGSLFDGSGGFPLAGALNGIIPLWASEIEMYPIAVTRSRFPGMEHLGNVMDIHGDKIQPVDVITFGSPCQDLSVAGKRAGIHDGQRSNLFFEAIRIIKEMREATNGEYPKFAVWENVPGAFSSNEGEDFRCVLEAFAGIFEEGVSIPRPQKWGGAGEIVGDGYSVAWRTLDAQYWGVPQRRKRIYLVADFAGERAGKILFEREGVRGHTETGGEARQGTAQDAEGSAGRSDSLKGLNLRDCGGVSDRTEIYALQGNGIDRAEAAGCNGKGWREDVCYTLDTIDRPAICFKAGQGAKARSLGASEKVTPTLGSEAGGNSVPSICYPQVFHTLTARNAGNVESSQQPNCVCYDARGNGDGVHCPTLTGDHERCVTNYTALCIGHGEPNSITMSERANTLTCMHDQQAIIADGKPPRKYIIRRLTPIECCRLQGFPDGWGIPDHKDELSDDELTFWQGVCDTYAKVNGKSGKQYKLDAMLKWYNGLHTDSAEYKMWGNGIALPCAAFVLGEIAVQLRMEG